MSENLPLEIDPREVKKNLDAGEKLVLLDVREEYEHQICRVEGAKLVPMNDIPARLQELEALADEGTLMVYCHHGVRSLNVVSWLRRQGLEDCQSIRGGIERWSLEVDGSVPRY